MSTNVREYAIFVNDTYSISDMVEVTTPWDIEQIIFFQEGDDKVYLSLKYFYDGRIWR